MAYPKDPTKDIKITFVEHPSARRIVLSWFQYDHPGVSSKRMLAMRTEFTVFLGKKWEQEATVAQLLSVVEATGVWAYCKHASRKHKEIHYWFSDQADPFIKFETIMHEVSHAVGYKSEVCACKIAGIGVFCLHALKDRFLKEAENGEDGCRKGRRLDAGD